MTPAQAREKAEEIRRDLLNCFSVDVSPGDEPGCTSVTIIDLRPEMTAPILARALLLAQAEAVEECAPIATGTTERPDDWDVPGLIANRIRDRAAALRRAAEEIK